MIKTTKICLLTLGLIASYAGHAATITTSFQVTADIAAKCNTVTANTLAFGTFDPVAATNLDVNTTMAVTCSRNTPYTIALNGGSTATGTIANRLMTNGTDTLQYQIYTTTGRTIVWGDGTGTSQTVPGTGSGVAQTVNVYGRIPGTQVPANPPVGSYTDTITVTVTF